jgi:hypothetical protein
MSAQKRGRNYIDLLHQENDERRMAGISAAATRYPIMDHILDLVVARFRRRSVTR